MHTLKVLVLEDHPFQLMALHQMLNANHVYDVLTAGSVEQARQSLSKRGPVDIAICDLQMEGPDGLELIRELAQGRQARALVILSSAPPSVLDSVARLARQQGIQVLGCLQKPASVSNLRHLLEAYQHSEERSDNLIPITRSVPTLGLKALGVDEPLSALALTRLSEQWIAHFQPKVSLEGEVLGVEALVRWQHPEHALLSPDRFLPALEQAGLVVPLTWRVLELALQLSARVLREQGTALPVAVNFAPVVLEQPDLAAQVLALLARYGLPAGVLTLEVLEQFALEPSPRLLEDLLRLRLQGCKLSMDDFGTGASNSQRLLQLPFTELKIPTEFIRGMADDPRKSAVVAGAMFMARRMALEVAVEGVETLDDYHGVMALGVAAVQGYLISRPLCETDLLRWLAERECPAFKPAHAPASK